MRFGLCVAVLALSACGQVSGEDSGTGAGAGDAGGDAAATAADAGPDAELSAEDLPGELFKSIFGEDEAYQSGNLKLASSDLTLQADGSFSGTISADRGGETETQECKGKAVAPEDRFSPSEKLEFECYAVDQGVAGGENSQ